MISTLTSIQKFIVDNTGENPESQSWCPGANEIIDLTLIPLTGTKLVYSHEYDTYCAEVFCNNHENCKLCLTKEIVE